MKSLPALLALEPTDFHFAETPMEASAQEDFLMKTENWWQNTVHLNNRNQPNKSGLHNFYQSTSHED